VPIVFSVGPLINVIILVTLLAVESRPSGKIIRDNGVLICFHLRDGGLPPKIWLNAFKQVSKRKNKISGFLLQNIQFL
jgi:hypothetical protein